MSDTTDRVLTLVTGVAGPERPPFTADDHLFDNAILDSFGLVMLVEALDDEFSIAIRTDDLTAQNFGTVNDIAALVDEYVAAAG